MKASTDQKSTVLSAIRALDRVILYIDDHLDGSLSLDSLCQVACLSKYHFHRQFTLYCGMPLHQYTQERRLQVAATRLLAEPAEKIIDVGIACGFSSAEHFSRVFTHRFGQSPTAFRQTPNWSIESREQPAFQQIRNHMMKQTMDVIVVDFEPINLMVLTHHGSPWTIQASIDTFIRWRKAHRLSPKVSRTFNIIYNNPQDVEPEDYKVDLGVSIPERFSPQDDQLYSGHIPGGRCAKARHVGHDDGLYDAVTYLYRQWLPESGESLRDAPLFFERFPETGIKIEPIVDIYLPIL